MTYIDPLPRELQDLLERYRSSPGYRVKIETHKHDIRVIISYPDLVVAINLIYPRTRYMVDFLAGREIYYMATPGVALKLCDGYLVCGSARIKLSQDLTDALIEAERLVTTRV